MRQTTKKCRVLRSAAREVKVSLPPEKRVYREQSRDGRISVMMVEWVTVGGSRGGDPGTIERERQKGSVRIVLLEEI